MFVKQMPNREYYLCTRKKNSGVQKVYNSLFLVKHDGTEGYCGGVNGITFPKEFIGKKVRIKVEVEQ